MRASQARSETHPVAAVVRSIPALGDQVLATNVEWRETTDGIADTYKRSSVAPAMQEAVRFAAYTAARDQEQTVATVYAASITELERWLPDPDRGSRL